MSGYQLRGKVEGCPKGVSAGFAFVVPLASNAMLKKAVRYGNITAPFVTGKPCPDVAGVGRPGKVASQNVPAKSMLVRRKV